MRIVTLSSNIVLLTSIALAYIVNHISQYVMPMKVFIVDRFHNVVNAEMSEFMYFIEDLLVIFHRWNYIVFITELGGNLGIESLFVLFYHF